MDWIKAHIMCGVKTNIITAVEISHANDYPLFAPLVEQTSQNFVMNQVSADKAYSSNRNLQLVVSKAAQPYIDFKSNTKPSDKSPLPLETPVSSVFLYPSRVHAPLSQAV
jgi:hypothetical protein